MFCSVERAGVLLRHLPLRFARRCAPRLSFPSVDLCEPGKPCLVLGETLPALGLGEVVGHDTKRHPMSALTEPPVNRFIAGAIDHSCASLNISARATSASPL